MRKTKQNKTKLNFFSMKGLNVMAISTFAAGLVIVAVTALLELNERDFNNKKEKFENSK